MSSFAVAAAAADAVVLEGLHALKHALRFGAAVTIAVSPDVDAVLALAASVAPDLVLEGLITPVSLDEFNDLKPRSARTLGSPVLAVARKPSLVVPAAGPVVLLDSPRYAGNAGAVVRVAAAAGAAGVLMTGELDPWGPAVVRAAAGLHWALPVARVDSVPVGGARPVVTFDPDGSVFDPSSLPPDALLVFGGERRGVPDSVVASADHVWRLPMRAGVSSLNLATSVAAVLYAWRLAG